MDSSRSSGVALGRGSIDASMRRRLRIDLGDWNYIKLLEEAYWRSIDA